MLGIVSAYAQGGTTGPLTWQLSGDSPNYTLTISGIGDMPDYTIPDYSPWYSYRGEITTIIMENGITRIGNCAFIGCNLPVTIDIPKSVTTIGISAFSSCASLTTIDIPNSVTTIGHAAFLMCSSLSEINIPNSVINIGEAAFNRCSSLKSINIPDGITIIENSTFYLCSLLTTINIPVSVTNIEDYAFSDCTSLTSINIPEYVTNIGYAAFSNCSSLVSINIPNSVTNIEREAFSNCAALKTINIPEGVTSIGGKTFQSCSKLSSINIPNSVTTIGWAAFSGCTSLSSINIPSDVTIIEHYAFEECFSLVTITNLNPEPLSIIASGGAFLGLDVTTITLKVLPSSVEAYQDSIVWRNFNIVGGDYTVNATVNNINNGYIIGNEVLYAANEEASIIAISMNNSKFENWTKDGVVVSTDNPYNFVVTEDMHLVANFKVTGIEYTDVPDFIVYPNPARNSITITGINENDNIVIRDLNGRTTMRTKATSDSPIIDISSLPKGIYIITVNSKSGKLVVN